MDRVPGVLWLINSQGENVEGMQEVTLAVMGAANVGKSTFMQCALDLKRPAALAVSTKKVSLEGVTSILRLVELPIDDVEITNALEVEWPETIGDEATPKIDGALLLYDVTDQGSTAQVPGLLSESVKIRPPYPLEDAKVEEEVTSPSINTGL